MSMFSMTSDALTKIFKKIKDNLNEKDYYIIRAALQGRSIITISNDSQVLSRKYTYGVILDYALKKKFYYSNGSTNTEITLSNLRTLLNGILAPCLKIPSSYWSSTPFMDVTGSSMLLNIVRCETVNGNTKWILYMDTDSEDQIYTASTSSKVGYYGSHTVKYGFYSQPWEIWIPSGASSGTVKIDW